MSPSSFACFLSKLPLILRVGRKKKKGSRYFQEGPNIEFEQDWSVGFGIRLGDKYKIKT